MLVPPLTVAYPLLCSVERDGMALLNQVATKLLVTNQPPQPLHMHHVHLTNTRFSVSVCGNDSNLGNNSCTLAKNTERLTVRLTSRREATRKTNPSASYREYSALLGEVN
jgi:hypothetical protein